MAMATFMSEQNVRESFQSLRTSCHCRSFAALEYKLTLATTGNSGEGSSTLGYSSEQD